ncbi:iron donor protein CyaY [Lampropedia aestuarii]|uniref:Iron-sulfur cluster assembly protein CyaY n=1 Tax=Lampropedia aestuarii TaxID=2562762 RepID=A0A4S5BEX2_9BURK|nr:iron donor protein CyaY [Lampropedia aestuarii]THJ30750.1 iron donor protein CyaY [Lampropedia aestuarii]
MTDLEYADHADALLLQIEQACDQITEESDVDLDAQRVGGMVTIVFPNRSQIVINQQRPLHEIWLAAKAGGFHFKFDGQAWQDTKGQGEFFAMLNRFATEQAGEPLNFSA